jgi:vitamin B12 transporter
VSRFAYCFRFLVVAVGWAVISGAQSTPPAADKPVELSAYTVLSTRIALQEPIATVATPASALRYEPLVDLQARSFAEGQADVTIRGGTFANANFSIAGLPLYDPQTGHYYAEIPVAPAMLSAPTIAVGADLAMGAAWNATSGAIAYDWRPVRSGAEGGFGVGEWNSWRTDFLAGTQLAGGWASDFGASYSSSDGPFADADHEISRFSARLQHRGAQSQTNLIVGYQDKFFGWPNMYTPFNSPETEDIQTLLLAGTHRWTPTDGAADFIEIGSYFRRNDDNYAFDRYAPVPAIPPFKHATYVTALGGRARIVINERGAIEARAWVLADTIESTSLRFGDFDSRTHATAGVYYTHAGDLTDGGRWSVRAGTGYDTSNRGADEITPVVEFAIEPTMGIWSRWSLGFSAASQAPSYTAVAGNPTGGLFRGNPDLDRATSRTIDLAGTFALGEWTGSIGGFYRLDDDLIDWTFRHDFWARSAAAVDLDTVGVEAFVRRSWSAVDLQLGYTWLSKDEDYGGLPVDGSFYALNFPNHRLTAAVVWRLAESIDLRMDNEFRHQESNPLRRNSTEETVLSSVGLFWRPAAAERWELSVQIDNLWDSDFEEIPATPAAPRMVAVGARWRW